MTRIPWSALRPSVLILALGCVSGRERPLPFGADEEPQLTVEVLYPRTGGSQLLAGRSTVIRVHAAEAGGRLIGVGYRMKRSFQEDLLGEETVFFPQTADTTIDFETRIPEDLRHNTQLDIFGIAYAVGEFRKISDPQVVLVLRCTPGAIWCR